VKASVEPVIKCYLRDGNLRGSVCWRVPLLPREFTLAVVAGQTLQAVVGLQPQDYVGAGALISS